MRAPLNYFGRVLSWRVEKSETEEILEFDTDWLTLGRHRVRLRSTRGFPSEAMREVVEVIRIAVDRNMSARARLVEVTCRQETNYSVMIGTTLAEDKVFAPQLEASGGSRLKTTRPCRLQTARFTVSATRARVMD
ncbi:protein of unknown function (plasmid) [Pararobbsia alpina]